MNQRQETSPFKINTNIQQMQNQQLPSQLPVQSQPQKLVPPIQQTTVSKYHIAASIPAQINNIASKSPSRNPIFQNPPNSLTPTNNNNINKTYHQQQQQSKQYFSPNQSIQSQQQQQQQQISYQQHPPTNLQTQTIVQKQQPPIITSQTPTSTQILHMQHQTKILPQNLNNSPPSAHKIKQTIAPTPPPQSFSPPSSQQQQITQQKQQLNVKIIDDFHIHLDQQIGKGRLCDVYLCDKPNRLTQSTEQLSAKVLPLEKLGFKGLNDIVCAVDKQFARFKPILSPHIVNLYQMYLTSNNYYIFVDCCEEGTLQDILSRNQNNVNNSNGSPKANNNSSKQLQQIFSCRQTTRLLQQFCRGYQEMHSRGIVHRGITPSKLFFSQNKLKIQHFSIAQLLLNAQSSGSSAPSSQQQIEDQSKNLLLYTNIKVRNYLDTYSAPQFFEQQPTTDKCDVWSLGTILFEMLYGYNPFQADSLDQIFEQITALTHDNVIQLPADDEENNISVPEELKSLIQQMLVYEEKDRISWQDIFKHSVLSYQELPKQVCFFCPVPISSNGANINSPFISFCHNKSFSIGMEVQSTVNTSKTNNNNNNNNNNFFINNNTNLTFQSQSLSQQAENAAVDLLINILVQHKNELNSKYFVESDVGAIESSFNFKILQKNKQICYLKHSQLLFEELHNSSATKSQGGVGDSPKSQGHQQQSNSKQKKTLATSQLQTNKQLFFSNHNNQGGGGGYPVLHSLNSDAKTREMNNIISIQLDKLIFFHRNQALFAISVLHSLSSTSKLMLTLPIQLVYMISFAIVGFYIYKLKYIYQILSLQREQLFASVQEFNIYVSSVLYKQTQKFIQQDLDMATQFANIIQYRVVQQLQEDSLALQIQCQPSLQNSFETQQKLQKEIDQLIDFYFDNKENVEQYQIYLKFLKGYIALLYNIIDLKSLDIYGLRFLYGLQILSEIDVFQNEENFLDFNFTKFHMENIQQPQIDALFINVIKFKNSE